MGLSLFEGTYIAKWLIFPDTLPQKQSVLMGEKQQLAIQVPPVWRIKVPKLSFRKVQSKGAGWKRGISPDS